MTQRHVDRWIQLMQSQAGFDASLDGTVASLSPQLSLVSDPGFDDPSLAIQVYTDGAYELTLSAAGGEARAFRCTCRDSPYSHNAVHIEYASPDAPLRIPVAPGDVVRARLAVSYKTRRGEARDEVLFSGTFTVPPAVHKLGAPGYNVDVPHLGSQMYFCAGNVGTKESFRTELLTFHMTLLV